MIYKFCILLILTITLIMSNKKIEEEVRKQIAKSIPIIVDEVTQTIIENINVGEPTHTKTKSTHKKIPKSLLFSHDELISMRFNEIKDLADKLEIDVVYESKPDYVNAILEHYNNSVFKPKKSKNSSKISRKVSEKLKNRLVTYDEDIGYYTSIYNNVKYVYDIKTLSIVGKIVKGNKCVPLSINEAKNLRNANFKIYHVNELRRSVNNVLSREEINKILNGKKINVSHTPPELDIEYDFYDDCEEYIENFYDDDDEDGDDILLDGDFDIDSIDDTQIEVDEIFSRPMNISDFELKKYRNAKSKNPNAGTKRLSDLTGIKYKKVKYIQDNYGTLMANYKRRNKRNKY